MEQSRVGEKMIRAVLIRLYLPLIECVLSPSHTQLVCLQACPPSPGRDSQIPSLPRAGRPSQGYHRPALPRGLLQLQRQWEPGGAACCPTPGHPCHHLGCRYGTPRRALLCFNPSPTAAESRAAGRLVE